MMHTGTFAFHKTLTFLQTEHLPRHFIHLVISNLVYWCSGVIVSNMHGVFIRITACEIQCCLSCSVSNSWKHTAWSSEWIHLAYLTRILNLHIVKSTYIPIWMLLFKICDLRTILSLITAVVWSGHWGIFRWN